MFSIVCRMARDSIPAIMAPPRRRDNPLTRSVAGLIGLGVLTVLVLACVATLPWTLGSSSFDKQPRYNSGSLSGFLLPPTWTRMDEDEQARFETVARERAEREFGPEPTVEQIESSMPIFVLGTDKLGRDLMVRMLAGGGVSIGIGLAAAAISVFIGTIYGAIAGYVGGRVDAVMMRIVDILYGLPYVLLVVLLAVAGDALVMRVTTNYGARQAHIASAAHDILVERGEPAGPKEVKRLLRLDRELARTLESEAAQAHKAKELSSAARSVFNVAVLFVAIGGVSWLTMSRVIRGQVLSLKAQPFMEAARATGVPVWRQFFRHLLPNLVGPIIVYATLTVPQAILQESFLSFLGIGVQPPLPSWGNLAADGLIALNVVKVQWWLLVFPCLLLGTTLLALNFVGEGLREAFDPKRARK